MREGGREDGREGERTGGGEIGRGLTGWVLRVGEFDEGLETDYADDCDAGMG